VPDKPQTPPGKQRASHKRPESEVDREGLARVVKPRMEELKKRGVNQAEVASLAKCAQSTIRNMQNGTGTSHYGHGLLMRVGEILKLPEADQLVKVFYPLAPRDPTLPSDADVTAERVVSQLEPYLADIKTIPAMQEDVAVLRERLESMADDIDQVKSQLKSLVDISYPPAEPS